MTSSPVTELLVSWSHGKDEALDELVPLVHSELKRIARNLFRRERLDHTLQPTALVNEAYLRLVDQSEVKWKDRAHFFAVSANLMRRILVDHARRRGSAKRGSGSRPLTLSEASKLQWATPPDLLALDDALQELQSVDSEQGRIVELRFFGGLTNEEIAETLGVSVSTVQRQFRLAKAWLYLRLSPGEQKQASR